MATLTLDKMEKDPKYARIRRYATEEVTSGPFVESGERVSFHTGDGVHGLKFPEWLISKICQCAIPGAEWLNSEHQKVPFFGGRQKDVIVCTKCGKLWAHFAYAFICECDVCESIFVNFPFNKYETCEGCS